MRKTTKELCQLAVCTLENSYLDNNDLEPITLKDAIDYCYREFIDTAETDIHYDRSARFDTKKVILKEIERLIKKNPYIKLKERR